VSVYEIGNPEGMGPSSTKAAVVKVRESPLCLGRYLEGPAMARGAGVTQGPPLPSKSRTSPAPTWEMSRSGKERNLCEGGRALERQRKGEGVE
jgi:hypothetical protein